MVFRAVTQCARADTKLHLAVPQRRAPPGAPRPRFGPLQGSPEGENARGSAVRELRATTPTACIPGARHRVFSAAVAPEGTQSSSVQTPMARAASELTGSAVPDA